MTRRKSAWPHRHLLLSFRGWFAVLIGLQLCFTANKIPLWWWAAFSTHCKNSSKAVREKMQFYGNLVVKKKCNTSILRKSYKCHSPQNDLILFLKRWKWRSNASNMKQTHKLSKVGCESRAVFVEHDLGYKSFRRRKSENYFIHGNKRGELV